MNKYGLIGEDISYSKSPMLHYAIAEVYNLNFSYDLIDVNEEEIVKVLNNYNYRGFNVTKPYKETVYNKVNKTSRIAQKVKAINTIYRKNNKLYGDNTDYYGFKYLIEYYKIKVKNKKILILGTGGAAKVVYYYLTKKTNDVYFASRTKKDKNIISYQEIINFDFDIIVNATPVGIYPKTDEILINPSYLARRIVIDLNYVYEQTKLMSYAKESYNGLIMLIIQAIYSNKRWHKKSLKITKEKVEKIKEAIKNV